MRRCAARRRCGRRGPPAARCRSNGFFGLHPSLSFLQESYQARELIVFHALASPYRERSHFDGQDVLENGSLRPHALQSGWLNRALAQLPGPAARVRRRRPRPERAARHARAGAGDFLVALEAECAG